MLYPSKTVLLPGKSLSSRARILVRASSGSAWLNGGVPGQKNACWTPGQLTTSWSTPAAFSAPRICSRCPASISMRT